jgi:hypothetical protein
MNSRAEKIRLYNIIAAVLLVAAFGIWTAALSASRRTPLSFDDAYMFARYAMNVRHGLGISWNLDGIHTYGETSLLWGLVVIPLSYLPMGPWAMLTLGSWLCSIGAVIAMAWVVSSEAQSELLRSVWRVLPMVAFPLTWTAVFTSNMATGMETMLATLIVGLFIGCVFGWSSGRVAPEIAACVGLLLFMTRPDAGIAIVLFPAMLFALRPRALLRWSSLLRLTGEFAIGVAAEMMVCKLYFHTALPLSFYMKGRHAYQGYVLITHPGQQLLAFLGGCEPFLLLLIFLARKNNWRLIACCVVPAFAVFGYLWSVTQIMGGDARYYAPYFPFFVIPALLVLDKWINVRIDETSFWPRGTFLIRSLGVGATALMFLIFSSDGVLWAVRKAERNSHFVYDSPTLKVNASIPLPSLPWETAMTDITDLLISPLPKGATVAATEVGYLGAKAPQVNVIDMAGLNDTDIALQGFDVQRLLNRRPDVIWMPNSDYTYNHAWMMSDPRVLSEYEVYAGAANYGIGIRKDSPYHGEIENRMQIFWNATYPQYAMKDYLVRDASWTRSQHKVIDD